MTYREAIQFLYDLRWFGTKLGLQHTFRLAQLAGNPQERLRFLHVAGTNGKGSTCAMLESIHRAAGRRVGLFTSPHLVAFGERIQVNRQPIAEAEIIRLVREMKALLPHFGPEEHPTFFEVVTVMALRYFAEQGCELVIWETGIGGRLDATSIVTPLACLITNIQFDHEKWLGHTLAQIAYEKAGIIKPRVPVLTGAHVPEALEVIRAVALRQDAPLEVVPDEETHRPPLDRLELPLPGDHQRMNAALVLAAVRVLQAVLPVREEEVVAGLRAVRWPGRFQIVPHGSGTVVLDGAHNPAGAEVLRAAFRKHFAGRRATLVLGILNDKDWATMARILAPLAERILLAPVASERTTAPELLAPVCRQANPDAEIQLAASLAEALRLGTDSPLLLITGSLYFIGQAMEVLGIQPGPDHDERALNEWSASPEAEGKMRNPKSEIRNPNG